MALKRQPARRQMVRANRFDPSQGASTSYDPVARLAQISAEWERNPGRMPGGSGSTGLLSNDAQGYTQMLGQQQEFMKLQDFLGGGEGTVNTRLGGELNPIRGGFDPATGRNNREAFGLPAGISGGALEGIVAATKKRSGKI